MSDFDAFAAKVTGGASLDDLLRQNKQKFDDVFQTHMRGIPAPREPEGDEGGTSEEDTAAADVSAETVAQPQAAVSQQIAPSPPASNRRSAAAEPQPTPLDGIFAPALGRLFAESLAGISLDMQATFQRLRVATAAGISNSCATAIADSDGQVLCADSAIDLSAVVQTFKGDLQAGDIIISNDPYAGQGGAGLAHWLVSAPVFSGRQVIGWIAARAVVADAGGMLPGHDHSSAMSVFAEGLTVPPVKLYQAGELNRSVAALLHKNARKPASTENCLDALVTALEAGVLRLQRTAKRYSGGLFARAATDLLRQGREDMGALIREALPEEPQSFEDQIDDDGLGGGPLPLQVTVWREGDKAFVDWTGTSTQSEGAMNAVLSPAMLKWYFGYLLAAHRQRTVAMNAGYLDAVDVTVPHGSVIHPYPGTAVGGGRQVLVRALEVLTGCLVKAGAVSPVAAGYGACAGFTYFGRGAERTGFSLSESVPGGLPGQRLNDGLDGHFFLPRQNATDPENLEMAAPVRLDAIRTRIDTGGAGRHRGGNGVEKTYTLLRDGYLSILDDRDASQPWGVNGGAAGALSTHRLIDPDGHETVLPAKCDAVRVQAGSRLIFSTAGGGGCGNPLDRPAALVQADVANRLVSREAAAENYGVILAPEDFSLDERATNETRERMKHSKKGGKLFDYGAAGGMTPPQAG